MTWWSLRRRRRAPVSWPAQPPSPWGPRPAERSAGKTGPATAPNPAILDGRLEALSTEGPAAAEAPAAAPPTTPVASPAAGPPQAAHRVALALPPAHGVGPWPEICEQFGLHLLVLAEQLRLSLDELEADEADPGRLEQLYRIDHGVTRMRRASRDLRVLAGRGEDALDGPVTSLLDVIRMAASAIERYGQVQVGKAAELAVVGYAADDVGSLMAVLLENATQYSPEAVTVSAHLMGDGAVMFRIEDSGIGMSPEQVAALNEMLAGEVRDVDEHTGRHTGFPVAHRIAHRHMITVRLASRPAPRTGTLAMVTVPPHLLCEIPEEDEAIHLAAPAPRPAAGSRVRGPRERGVLTSVTARHAAPRAPGELPRRESASLRGDRPAAAAGARAEAAAGMSAADQSAARRAFAADLAAFARASAALGHDDGTEGQGGYAAGGSPPWDHGSGPADGRSAQEGTVLPMTGTTTEPPRGPQDFGWLLDNFASSTPGVSHALIVSSDGLPLVAAAGMSADLADPLAAMTSGILALGNNIAGKVGEPRCEQMMLKFAGGHFLFMGIGALAGFAVLVSEGANLGVVAHQMAQLVDAVGHVLTPQLRDDLRRRMAGSALADRRVSAPERAGGPA